VKPHSDRAKASRPTAGAATSATRKPARSRAKADGGLVRVILDLCKMRRIWAWRANSGAVRTQSGGFVALAPPGTPDVLLVLPGGRLAGIEAKSPTGQVRTTQRAWARVAADHGVRYAVVRSATEARDVIDRWIEEAQR
jgi:hypothetical protein